MSLRSSLFAAMYDRMSRSSEEAGVGEMRQRLLGGVSGDILELGAGTGMNLSHYDEALASLVLTEPEPAMLRRLQPKALKQAPNARVVQASAEDLPFEDASFDAAVVGFGVRNVEDLEAGIKELRRVLRPGGRLGILEITTPRGFLAPFYRLWFNRVVPLLGRLLPGGAAYTYLPASVRRFPGPEQLAELLAACGFRDVQFRLFAGGIVALHVAEAAG